VRGGGGSASGGDKVGRVLEKISWEEGGALARKKSGGDVRSRVNCEANKRRGHNALSRGPSREKKKISRDNGAAKENLTRGEGGSKG